MAMLEKQLRSCQLEFHFQVVEELRYGEKKGNSFKKFIGDVFTSTHDAMLLNSGIKRSEKPWEV